jgi:hypothetical protein
MPPVVFSAQQKVNQQDRGGRSGHDHESITEEEESEHVVNLVRPQRSHDEVQLHKDSAKRQDARK